MNPIFEFLLFYVLVYKYVAIFIITFLGAIALPLPSGSILMVACALSLGGHFNPGTVFLIGLIGNVAGDNAGYWLVRRYGLRALEKIHLARFFKPERLEAARQKLDKHPILTIYTTRFFTAIAPAVNVAAGMSKLSYKRYLFYEVLGELTEVTLFCALGYILGKNWQKLDELSAWVWILGGFTLSYIAWKVIFKKTKKDVIVE